jgi:HTH-type transcriptional regulator/antitoxin HigA
MIEDTDNRARPEPLGHDYGVKPGELIRFELSARGLTQADLATRAGISAKHLNQVIQDAVPLSAETALRLERALGIPAAILTQADAVNQANKQRTKFRETLAEHTAWFTQFPRQILLQLEVINARDPLDAQIEELLKWLGVADSTAYDAVYGEAALSFRRAQHWKVDPHATALWLRSAELKAQTVHVGRYTKAAFVSLLPDLRRLTVDPIGESFPRLQRLCAEVGVTVVFTHGIDGTRASAAVRWLGPERPVIALTERGKHEDSLWFSFFHEAGHIVRHPQRKSVIELDDADDQDGAETEANDFAKATLLQGRLDQLPNLDSVEQLQAFADDLGIHPGIAAAIRAYDLDTDAWRLAAKLRRKLDASTIG